MKNESAVHIGAKVTKGSQEKLAKQLISIMKAGFDYRQDGETIRYAMSLLIKVAEVKDVHLSDIIINTKRE